MVALSESSQARIDANRANALKSTGPKTAEGKQRVSRNALRHGMFAQQMVLEGESREDFDDFSREIIKRINPRDVLELSLVQQIIASNWRIQRLWASEAQVYRTHANIIRGQIDKQVEEQNAARRRQIAKLRAEASELERLMSYATKQKRPVNPQRLEQHRQLLERIKQMESEPAIQSPRVVVPAGHVLAKMVNDEDSAIEKLHAYERRLENTLHRCMKQIREIRKCMPLTDEEPTRYTEELLNEAAEEQPHGDAVGVACGTKPL